MLDVVGFKHRKRHGHAESVVCTESRTLRANPIPVDYRFNRVFFKIMHGVGILLRHHIHVSLKNHALHILAARSRPLADDDITDRIAVDNGLETMVYSPVIEIFCDFFLVLRWSRDTGDFIKVLPHNLRIQILYCHSYNILIISFPPVRDRHIHARSRVEE